MTPDRFLAVTPVFTRTEFIRAMAGSRRDPSPGTVTAHLVRWQRQGRITQVKRGVYVREQAGAGAADLLTLASRMAEDAALAYHTALEAHGYAQSFFEKLFFVTWTKTKPLTFSGRRFVAVRPRVGLLKAHQPLGWIETVERAGATVRVTSLERTLADVLDRPNLAGGLEEVWRSCSGIPGLDLRELEAYLNAVGSKVLVAKVGFFLERHRQEMAIPGSLLTRLRSLVPRNPVYMQRGQRGRVVPSWNLVAPHELLAGDWETPA